MFGEQGTRLDSSLPQLLPDAIARVAVRAERAVLRAAAHSLQVRPARDGHVAGQGLAGLL